VQQFVIVVQLEQAVFLAHAEIAPSENITETPDRPFAIIAARERFRILLVHEHAPLVLLELLSPHMGQRHAHPAPPDNILQLLGRRRALTACRERIQIRLVRRSVHYVPVANSPMCGHLHVLTVLLENITLILGWGGVFPALKGRTLIQPAHQLARYVPVANPPMWGHHHVLTVLLENIAQILDPSARPALLGRIQVRLAH
jgi:hypothetical protein